MSTRLPTHKELFAMPQFARAKVLRAYAQSLDAEESGLRAGMQWSRTSSRKNALRALKRRRERLVTTARDHRVDLTVAPNVQHVAPALVRAQEVMASIEAAERARRIAATQDVCRKWLERHRMAG